MSMHFGGRNQLRNYRLEGILENPFVARPASGIRQMRDRAAPASRQKCAQHVPFDGTQQSRNHDRLEFDNRFRKRLLACPASRPPQFRIESIHRPSTQVDEITTGSLKDSEKILVIDCGIDRSKRIAHRPVKPGVSLVKEAPGRGSRFPDEQQANMVGTKRPPQSFSLVACGINRQRELLSLPDPLGFRRPRGPRS